MRSSARLLVLMLVFGVSWAGGARAEDVYVSKERGNNQNAGTKAAPLRELEAALAASKAGDRIHVAQGNYTGLRDKGYLEAPHPVELTGGYGSDFSSRDVVRYPTTVSPDNASAASGRRPLLSIVNVPPGSRFVLDGFIFDRGDQNAYSPKDGVVENLGGRRLAATEKPAVGYSTVEEPLVSFTNKVNARVEGDVVIRNCTFLNGHFGIQGGFRRGTVRILNNVLVANKMAAIEVFGTGGRKGPRGPVEKDGHVEIAYNTILFTWSRLKDFADMGYGVRIMTMVSYDIHHNLIGGSVLTAVDHTRGNPNAWVKFDDNVLFLNKQAPLLYVEPGKSAAGLMERVKIEDIGADLGLASCRNNTDLLGAPLPLHPAYVAGFLDARYSEAADFDPNSPANVMREVFGLPKQGKLTTRVTMFANRYPAGDALKLFGAKPNMGAQTPR